MELHQKGFTLIELLISLVIGLIVVAAAGLLFVTGQKSYMLQQGTSDIQDNANFGLDYIVKDVRLANLDSVSASLTDRAYIGGVVLTSAFDATTSARITDSAGVTTIYSNLEDKLVGPSVVANLLSRSSGQTVGNAPLWAGSSNVQEGGVDLASDQLVIQYRPVVIGGFDCEGTEITRTDRVIVQRYFLREDTNKASNEPNKPLALACDAGYYSTSGSDTAVTNFGDAGEIIMKRVDYLRVLLDVVNTDGNSRYLSVKEYLTETAGFTAVGPRIVAVHIGILARSNAPVGNDEMIKEDQKFQVLDKTVTVKASATNKTKYVRQVVSQGVALRNALGGRGS